MANGVTSGVGEGRFDLDGIVTRAQIFAFLYRTVNVLQGAPVEGVADGTIVFSGTRNGDSEIFVMDADGSNLRQLTNNTYFDWAPSWSPDGTQLAFISDRDGDWEVFVMDADGSNQRQITNNTYLDLLPTWSPDGTQIAFSSTREGAYEIFVMDADGSNQRQLPHNTHIEFSASLSPDGSKVSFVSDRDGDWEIFVMDADGSNQRQLTNNTSNDEIAFGAWSPHALGKGSDLFDDVPAGHWADEAIGWAVANGITTGVEEGRFDLNGTVSRSEIVTFLHRTIGLVQSTSQGGTHGRWSPDGTQIAFDSDRDGDWEVFVMSADGTNQPQITNLQGSAIFGDVPEGSKANDAIGWAFTTGITAGVGGGRFDPDGTVTRAQIVTFLHRTALLVDRS